MSWMWRGEYMPASKGEYHRIQQQLESETFPDPYKEGVDVPFHQLSKERRAEIENKRLQVCRLVFCSSFTHCNIKTNITKTSQKEYYSTL